MIKAADKEKAKKLGIDIDAIVAAHQDAKDVDIVLPDGEVFTADMLKTRDENTKKEGEKEGEKKALTIAISEINKHTGLKIEAERFGDLGKQIKDNIHASTDDKVKTLTTQVNELLKDKETLATEAASHKTKAEKLNFEYKQFANLPENRSKTMSESEYLTLLEKRGVEVKEDGVYKNGVLMTNVQTRAALPHKEAYQELFSEYNWIEKAGGSAGGRGGGNSGGASSGKARTQSEALKKWEDANPGKNPMSPQATAFVTAEAKDNPTFDWTA